MGRGLMPIKGESLRVVERALNEAHGYLQKQSPATWGVEDPDTERARIMRMLGAAVEVVTNEQTHIRDVEHKRELRKLGLIK